MATTTSNPPTSAAADLALAIGRQLRTARGDRSLRDVAGELNIRHGALLYLERGEDNPTLSRLTRVADAYGCDVEVRIVPRRRARSA
jgi:transcriptional regulator with XRE-family HTH domain